MLKRALDLAVSGSALVVLSPVMLAIAVWIRKDSPGPIFYRGVRAGRGNRPFEMLKFRTMVVDAEKKGGSSTAEDDPRITPSGAFLRRFKLDELPQFINVFKGEMSLVGPRPQVQWAVDLYKEDEKDLLKIRPGITDFASLKFRNEGEILKGSKDPDKDYMEKIAPEKIKLGLEYVRNGTLLTDLKIIAATAGAVVGFDPEWCLPGRRTDVGSETASNRG